jgi:hypothetical protein
MRTYRACGSDNNDDGLRQRLEVFLAAQVHMTDASPIIEVVDLGAPQSISLAVPASAPVPRAAPATSSELHGVELLVNSKRSKTPPAFAASAAVLGSLDEDLASLDAGPALTLRKEAPLAPGPALGTASARAANTASTWDGFETIRPSSGGAPPAASAVPVASKAEVLKEKFGYLRKLEAMEKQGVKISRRYTMESSLDEMKGEFDMIADEREKASAVRFQAKMVMAGITGIEFLNSRFDPFDVRLDGWGETAQENISDFDDVFGELHEKYKSKARIAPELKLLFMLGGSAVMAHMSNTMLKSAVPGVQDLLRDNPDLMRQFNNAAAASMAKEQPGLHGFVSEFAPPSRNRTPTTRQDMAGPRDIGDILGKLKRDTQPPATKPGLHDPIPVRSQATTVPPATAGPSTRPGGDDRPRAPTSARPKPKSERTQRVTLAS